MGSMISGAFISHAVDHIDGRVVRLPVPAGITASISMDRTAPTGRRPHQGPARPPPDHRTLVSPLPVLLSAPQ
ncbi:hypothetical protein OG322_23340 [Streptomyces sp. NBC_01260]|uniref:Uncharacterized protein n=1 Tax=Streptomyces laculatispora TaxID=887464 RepID=A0ABY9IAX7_9ACTN|nr:MULTISPECIES: hypothetical protein [Streptomyces]WLQ42781.1 hypothetical protein P8A22_24305 [Streptomyces laculatispora]